MHMYDMVKIDIIGFEIVGGGGSFLKPPPPSRIVGCLKHPGSDRVKYSKDLVPMPIVELFTRNYEFHNHYTRQSQSLHTAIGRNEAIYKTFTFHGIIIGITYLQEFQ